MKTKPTSPGGRIGFAIMEERRPTPENTVESPTGRFDVYELSRLVCVPVTIDESGWLRSAIELLFVRTADGIHPTELRLGVEVPAADIRQLGNAFDLCERYNRAINQLRLVGSPEVMQKIAARQEERMGYRRVKYFTLAREIEFLSECVTGLTE